MLFSIKDVVYLVNPKYRITWGKIHPIEMGIETSELQAAQGGDTSAQAWIISGYDGRRGQQYDLGPHPSASVPRWKDLIIERLS